MVQKDIRQPPPAGRLLWCVVLMQLAPRRHHSSGSGAPATQFWRWGSSHSVMVRVAPPPHPPITRTDPSLPCWGAYKHTLAGLSAYSSAKRSPILPPGTSEFVELSESADCACCFIFKLPGGGPAPRARIDPPPRGGCPSILGLDSANDHRP